MAAKGKSPIVPVPHSWSVPEWPRDVYPHSASRGRYVVRAFRDELVSAGALVRVGRDLVVMGASYSSWLTRQSSNVAGFEIAPNRARDATAA
jgi:hypothetical protein